MDAEARCIQRGPFRSTTVRGEPYHINGRTLIPEARLITFGKARATIGQQGIGGWGAGFVRVIPLALVEETAEGTRRIAISDATSNRLWLLLALALAVTAFLTAVRWSARCLRTARTAR